MPTREAVRPAARPGSRPPGEPRPGGRGSSGRPGGGRQGDSGPVESGPVVRRAVTLLGLSLVAPGSAQLIAGVGWRARIGRVVLRVWLGLVAGAALLGVIGVVHRQLLLWLVTQALVLRLLALLLFGLSVVWPVLVADAWQLGDPPRLPLRARRRVAGLAAVLVLVALLVPLAAGRRAWSAADLIDGIFGAGHTSAAVDGRYTVLLLGGDAGPDRVGTRPDSVTLASIDEEDGRTVLFSFPRNLQNIPFPAGTPAAAALPHGWNCGDECLLNAIYTWGAQHPQLFPGAADPGAAAMKQAVQGITGLPVNYYVLIDLKGFRSLIDAVGGIDVVAATRVPIGGGTSRIYGWIQPGKQHMDGFHALWYARSREGASDYARMQRQRCVMTAMVNQLDPTTLLTRFQKIAAAGRQVVSTDIPAGQLPAFITLGQQAKQHRISSVQFVPPLIVPHHPDYAAIRQRIASAIVDNQRGASRPLTDSGPTPTSGSTSGSTTASGAAPAATGPASGTASGAASGTGPATGSAASSVDVRQVCAAA